MKRAVPWDSSAVPALFDANDADHATAARIAEEIADEKRPFAGCRLLGITA